ncbi:hypothetical protein AVEN_127980-1 [Araneus ventricosus]|uniref:Uncharacterized protein n=1 Tax=Araneus ventricosus TaxID=182803 RepID=A0A4Y1ZZN5_ARAVE|nr:hypothetical protein AVEN_127980-1 [Araneus ventricosus]
MILTDFLPQFYQGRVCKYAAWCVGRIVWAMPKSCSMGHMNKSYFLTSQKTPRFKKKPKGEGRGQWSVDAMKLATARGAAVAWWKDPGFGVGEFQVRNPIPLCGAR